MLMDEINTHCLKSSDGIWIKLYTYQFFTAHYWTKIMAIFLGKA